MGYGACLNLLGMRKRTRFQEYDNGGAYIGRRLPGLIEPRREHSGFPMLATMLSAGVALLLWIGHACSYAAGPNVAFFYGANPPWDELKAYDIVVVEPDQVADPKAHATPRTALFAYLSVGEVEYERRYAGEIPQGAVRGRNEVWRSHVIDQAHPEWPRFFIDRIVAPLWKAGYRGFFLDTLDSFQLIAKTDEERARQAQALVATLRELRRQFPEAKLIFNRGFEVLPELHGEAYAVAAESLFRGWDPKERQYVEVPEADRKWLLGQLERVRDAYRLPVIAIDYTAPGARSMARETARKIAALGIIPWVSNSELDQLGLGNIEVTPRRVLMLYDGAGRDANLYAHRIHVQAKALLNGLGYTVDYADINKPLPAFPLVGRYAGIVSWFADDRAVSKPGVREWLSRQREHGMRMAVLGNFPFPLTDALAVAFGLSAGPPRVPRTVSIEVRDALIGHASSPAPDPRGFTPLRANHALATLLRLRSDSGDTMDAAALMPWGGYVLSPYESAPLAGADGDRWLIQPAEFMRRALALPPAPVNGRIERLQSDDSAGTPSTRVGWPLRLLLAGVSEW